jgi:hypothetical protein
LIPNIKCIAWNFDGSNSLGYSDKDRDEKLKMLRFENGDNIPDVEGYFTEGHLL